MFSGTFFCFSVDVYWHSFANFCNYELFDAFRVAFHAVQVDGVPVSGRVQHIDAPVACGQYISHHQVETVLLQGWLRLFAQNIQIRLQLRINNNKNMAKWKNGGLTPLNTWIQKNWRNTWLIDWLIDPSMEPPWDNEAKKNQIKTSF